MGAKSRFDTEAALSGFLFGKQWFHREENFDSQLGLSARFNNEHRSGAEGWICSGFTLLTQINIKHWFDSKSRFGGRFRLDSKIIGEDRLNGG